MPRLERAALASIRHAHAVPPSHSPITLRSCHATYALLSLRYAMLTPCRHRIPPSRLSTYALLSLRHAIITPCRHRIPHHAALMPRLERAALASTRHAHAVPPSHSPITLRSCHAPRTRCSRFDTPFHATPLSCSPISSCSCHAPHILLSTRYHTPKSFSHHDGCSCHASHAPLSSRRYRITHHTSRHAAVAFHRLPHPGRQAGSRPSRCTALSKVSQMNV
jgi:hypothetical protein